MKHARGVPSIRDCSNLDTKTGKLWLVMLLLLVANFALVVADEHAPTTSVGEEDVAELQRIIDQLPFDEDGETNFSKYKLFYTRAEIRIDAINAYLDENAGWMRYLFHMRPQISVLFALNVYFILFFFMVLVLNAKGLWFFIERARNARLFGLAIFVVFATIGLYVGLAQIVTNFLIYVWVVLLPAGFWLAIIAIIVLIVLIILAFFTGGATLKWILKYFEAKAKFKKNLEQAASSEAVNKMVEQMTKK